MGLEKSSNVPIRWAWPGAVVVPVRVTFGASTAITNWKGQGIVSVTKASQGVVTFTLAHGYAGGCVGISVSREGAASTAHLFPIVTTDNSDAAGSTPTVNVSLTSEAGTVGDPTSGDVYCFLFVFDQENLLSTVTP